MSETDPNETDENADNTNVPLDGALDGAVDGAVDDSNEAKKINIPTTGNKEMDEAVSNLTKALNGLNKACTKADTTEGGRRKRRRKSRRKGRKSKKQRKSGRRKGRRTKGKKGRKSRRTRRRRR